MSHIVLCSFPDRDEALSEAELALLLGNIFVANGLPNSETLATWFNSRTSTVQSIQIFEDPQHVSKLIHLKTAPTPTSSVKFSRATSAHYNTALRIIRPTASKTFDPQGAIMDFLLAKQISRRTRADEQVRAVQVELDAARKEARASREAAKVAEDRALTLQVELDAVGKEVKKSGEAAEAADDRTRAWKARAQAAMNEVYGRVMDAAEQDEDDDTILVARPYPSSPTRTMLAQRARRADRRLANEAHPYRY